MQYFDDEQIRRVLEESDGEDTLFNDYDCEELDGDADVEIDECEEETIEAITREAQHGGEMGESAYSEILSGQHENAEVENAQSGISDSPTCNSPIVATLRTLRSRRIQSQVSLDSEWKVIVKDLSRKLFTGHDEPTRQNLLFDTNTDLFTIFRKIIDDDILKLMVHQTNLYAARLLQEPAKPHSRKKRWSLVDESEMLKFLGVVLLMGIIPFPTIESYWKKDVIYYHPLLHNIKMSYNRFTLILKCWHFCDNEAPRRENDRLYKISPLLDIIIENSRTIYTPGDTVVVDESMVHFRGRLHFRQYIPSKSHKYGIKIYKLCTVDGFTWGYQIYCGQSERLFDLDTTGSIVVKLAEGLLDEGRCIITDNYYTSVPLAEFLISRNTDLCGTLNKKRRGLPKDVTDAALQIGDIAVKQKNENITVLKWKDKRDVCALSTCHGKGLSLTTSRLPKLKPDVILTYNKGKKGIDIADQLSSYNTPIRKTVIWYKKVATDLLAIAVINSMIIYNDLHPEKKERYNVLAANEAFVKRLLKVEPDQQKTREAQPQPSTSRSSEIVRQMPFESLSSSSSSTLLGSNRGSHFLEPIGNVRGISIRRRCVGCYKKLIDLGSLPKTARAKAKRVTTHCNTCKKTYCLQCFSEILLHK
ncbi:unnamed protein product [Parnassius mnemosyne]|uniref:PiggyBac transposable element-derived protein domain-containing protein n=1 Tax=Parnassius mnemosyne TaxID=213953 RepID=A0AAV1KRU0_9NEOP